MNKVELMKFICNLCNYSTDVKFCYEKHLLTKKHIEKVNNDLKISQIYPIDIPISVNNPVKFVCDFCNTQFTKPCNLSRHRNNCSLKKQSNDNFNIQINELNSKIAELNIKLNNQSNESTIKLNDYVKMLDQKDETISVLKSEVAHLKSIVNNTGSIIKTSVSTMAYVINNYRDAPALESLKDYSAIQYENDNTEFIENLIYEHNNNKLHIYISDFIIKTYKKDDPSKQSLWNSDTSRLTYLVREIITNNKVDWKIDKKGIKTTKFIIDPILEYIDEQVRRYVEAYEVDHRISAKEAEKQMMKLKSGMEIIKSIETKVLNEEILKYITPHFYLNKNDIIDH